MKDNLLKIIQHFGKENQLEKLKEELNELLEAIDSKNEDEMFKEVIDVIIMAWQLLLIFKKTDDEIDRQVNFKINRTLERIESGYYEK